jgi:hypothetical protein
LVPDTEMVAEVPWLPFGVGQVAALAVGALVVMIMPTDRPRVASAPVSARLRARGRVAEVMSRFLLFDRAVGVSGFPAPASGVTGSATAGAGPAGQR